MTSTTPIHALSSLEPPNSELVLGIVAAVGTDLDQFQNLLADYLKQFKYTPRPVRLTDFFKVLDLESKGILTEHPNSCQQISLRMDAGNYLRKEAQRGDVLALHAAAEIHQARKARLTQPPVEGESEAQALRALEEAALHRTAYILRSLKHVDEVKTLRRIYGSSFFLIALYSTKKERKVFLTGRKGGDADVVEKLIERDEQEDEPHGQKARDTFALADVFIRANPKDPDTTGKGLERFLKLVFGDPHITPTRDEHTMYMAFASSLRSADLSRQVGATITNAHGDVIATGANDVPCSGGGQYWPDHGDRDKRDYSQGADANEVKRNAMILKVMRKLKPSPELSDEQLLKTGEELLGNTGIRDLIEFSRAVHAEMDALMACCRIGVSARGGTLYCTTFPCHICAKHIIDAGIQRVVYIEPYPKSLAKELHGDAIAVEEEADEEAKRAAKGEPAHPPGRVRFEPFIGVGPRYFPQLFAINLGNGYPIKRKITGGQTRAWTQADASVRVPNMPFSYVDREAFAFSAITNATKEASDGPAKED